MWLVIFLLFSFSHFVHILQIIVSLVIWTLETTKELMTRKTKKGKDFKDCLGTFSDAGLVFKYFFDYSSYVEVTPRPVSFSCCAYGQSIDMRHVSSLPTKPISVVKLEASGQAFCGVMPRKETGRARRKP